jgi:hypothetical protein
MKAHAWFAALLLCACGHEFETTMKPTTPPSEALPDGPGRTHQPYAGKPKYLAAARPLQATTSAAPGADNPCATRSASCDLRLRSGLTAVDGQILALELPPTETALQALRASLVELTPLLAAYPDLDSEREELAALVEKLPTLAPIDQSTARRRMIELTDLLRLQLSAAQ